MDGRGMGGPRLDDLAAALAGWHAHLPHLPHLHLPRGVADFAPGTGVAAAAAAMFAVGSILQHEAATRCSSDAGLDLARLVRQRSWAVGQASTVLATSLQVVALGLAPVSIVQPVVAGSLVIALVIRSVREHCLPSRMEVIGAACTAGGLVVFLAAARPAPGAPTSVPDLLPVLVAFAGAVLAVFLATRAPKGPWGALACGSAGGLAAGVAAVLISAALKVLGARGLGATVASAPLWTAIAVAVTSQLASQQAYSRGPLAWSLPALTVLDPLAAVPTARVLLGERLEPGHAAVWLPAAAVAAVGVVLLAHSGEGCRRPLPGRRRRAGATAAPPSR